MAAMLHQAGQEVVLVDYRPERAARLDREGLLLRTPEGEARRVRVPVRLASEAGPASLVVVAVKTPATAAAARLLPELLTPGGLVLTVQNGLGNLEHLAQAAGWERLLAGVSFLGATRPRDGEVIFAGRGPTFIGPAPGARVSPEELEAVAELFRQAGLPCEVRGNIETMLWEKLLVNVAVNPLTALLRVRNGVLPRLPPAWEVALAAAREAQAVAGAQGLQLTLDPESRLREVCAATAANLSSMLQDVLSGRETEIAALNGEVAARGAALGVPTPVNTLLTRLVAALTLARPHRVG
jgi:2-dehydropantoate 2-reductase